MAFERVACLLLHVACKRVQNVHKRVSKD